MPGAAYDVVVVGAGLTGLSTALLLARQGRRVAVLEARTVGAVTSGNTTGKVSLLQGSVLSGIRRHVGPEAVAAYVAANREGQAWLVERLGQGEVLQRRDAFTYAVTQQGQHRLAGETAACREAGLAVEEIAGGDAGLPFPVRAAIRLPDQAQMHPIRLLDGVVAELRRLGGVVVEGTRMTGLRSADPCRVRTSAGEVKAGHVVLATGTPVLDRGLHFAQLEALRSYALAYRVPGDLPAGMYLSVDRATRSLRTAPVDGQELLVVGGNGHGVGRQRAPRTLVAALDGWARESFAGAELTHRWSAQDYRSFDHMPIIGPMPGTGDRVLVATGFNKWGMAGGVAAALALSGRIVGVEPTWAPALGGRVPGPRRTLELARVNAVVGAQLASGWAAAEFRATAGQPPTERAGEVGRDGVTPMAVSTVGGTTRRVSAICTHLGGVLRWNDAECSWDCPLHGSRFAADGTVLEGPATRDLPRR